VLNFAPVNYQNGRYLWYSHTVPGTPAKKGEDMDADQAAALNNAVIQTGHPRSDYRTEEAQKYTRWLDEFAQKEIAPGCRLIDLGCAAGKQTFKAEEMGAGVVGLDCAMEALAFAREVGEGIDSRAQFVGAAISSCRLL
jgi:2-polyprenyl-3-methyl-5-hydroxy-6-metoxy-1,4-benzoquinol methylase